MIPKKIVIKLINIWQTILIKLLNLHKSEIKIHVHHSNSKILRKKSGDKFNDLCGCCYSSNSDTHEIVIFYDKHTNKNGVINTLFHELCHAKLSKLSGLVTLKERKAE